MTTTQKVIKYGVIIFAILLIVEIFMFIFNSLKSVSGFFDDDDSLLKEYNIYECNSIIEDIEIENESSKLNVLLGDSFKVESNDKYVTFKEENGKLIIREKNHKQKIHNDKTILNVYIPKNSILNNFSLEEGAGSVNIDDLEVLNANFKLGAGSFKVNNITINNNLLLYGGAGSITIKNGKINNLSLESGVGKVYIKSLLTGLNKITTGVGELSLKLLGNKDDYRISSKKGIGNIIIDGEKVKDNSTYGNGKTQIKVKNGIGEINIKFE